LCWLILGNFAGSANAGINQWTSIGLIGIDVGSLVIDASKSAALCARVTAPYISGVFKSTNGGGSWSPANSGLILTFTPIVTTLAIDPSSPATVYAVTFMGEVFKSIDGGGGWSRSWNPVQTGMYVDTLVIDPSNSATVYVGAGGKVFKSTNGGGSWSLANSGLPNDIILKPLVIDPSNPATLYVGVYGGQNQNGRAVFKSTNGGGSWSPAIDGLSTSHVSALTIDPSNPATLYAGTFGVLYKSTNGGGVGVRPATACPMIITSISWSSTHPTRLRSIRQLAARCSTAPMAGGVGIRSATAYPIIHMSIP